jgi:hypothetical protein
MDEEVLAIEIEIIKSLIPNILFNKLKRGGIVTIRDYLELSQQDFERFQGVGIRTIELFNNFKNKIYDEPEQFLNLYLTLTTYRELPSNLDELAAENFILIFKNIVLEYLDLLNKDYLKDAIVLFYGINSNKYTRDEIARLYEYTAERIRQLQELIIQDIRKLLNGGYIEDPKVKIKQQIIQIADELIERIKEKQILSLQSVIDIYNSVINEELESEELCTLELLIDSIGLIKCGIVETMFTDATLYVINQNSKKSILKAASILKEVLKKSVSPLLLRDIIIKVRKKVTNAEESVIVNLLEILPEIEILADDNGPYYQLKFNKLGSVSNFVFRILDENKNVMHIDEIVSEINFKLSSNVRNRLYDDRESVVSSIASDNRFVALQKTGYWGLREWNENTETLKTLVKRAMYSLNRPSNKEEIISVVHQIRPQANRKSLIILIGKVCNATEDGNYILPEWRRRYPYLILKPKIRRIVTNEPEHHNILREEIITLLDRQENKSLAAREIIKRIDINNRRIKRPLFYKIFQDERFFRKSHDENEKLIITLI